MAGDLISREAALDEIRDIWCRDCYCATTKQDCNACNVGDFMNRLRDLPSVDAVPVVHGRWIEGTLYSRLICSECGHEALYNENANEPYFTKFCQECGAKMDE